MTERILYLNRPQYQRYPDGYTGDEIIDPLNGQYMPLRRQTTRRIIGIIHTAEKGFVRRYREEGRLKLHIPEGEGEANINLFTLPAGRTRILSGELADRIADLVKSSERAQRWSSSSYYKPRSTLTMSKKFPRKVRDLSVERLKRKLEIARENLRRGEESDPPGKRKIRKSSARIETLERDIKAIKVF